MNIIFIFRVLRNMFLRLSAFKGRKVEFSQQFYSRRVTMRHRNILKQSKKTWGMEWVGSHVLRRRVKAAVEVPRLICPRNMSRGPWLLWTGLFLDSSSSISNPNLWIWDSLHISTLFLKNILYFLLHHPIHF